MKKAIFFLAVLVVVAVMFLSAQTQEVTQTQEAAPTQEAVQKEDTAKSVDIVLGKIYFPRDFIHADKEYVKGTYRVVLTSKEGVPYFAVSNPKNELLFEELAVIKLVEAKNKRFSYRLRRELLQGEEYFRIRVIKPDQWLMAYFLVKKPGSQAHPATPAETTEPKETTEPVPPPQP